MKLPSPQPRRIHEPIGPLIDIVFLLLIFFMLLGALQWPESLPVKPPVSRTVKQSILHQDIVTLAADGRLSFMDQPLNKQALVAIVERQLAINPELTMAIEADARVASSEVIALLNTLRQTGIKRLSLLTVSRSSL